MSQHDQRAFRNRLVTSTSPYLRQHADNPVDWFEWGSEALERARELDRPILLSVGYSACHWCHVMAHESFEDPAIAALMNERFVNIKVDREERPDIDAIYQKVVQLMGQGGGWPLTVFLTPTQQPFYGGTYFPPQPAHGRPAFRQVLEALSDLHRERPEDVTAQAGAFMEGLADMAEAIAQEVAGADGPDATSASGLLTGARRLLTRFDTTWGGFGEAPKFPNATALQVLWRAARLDEPGSGSSRDAVRITLEKMACGGIYDHLGGGFARYSVDREWLVPHFEKMLYDNAQLLPLYAEAAVIFDEPLFRAAAEGIANHLETDMTVDAGAYAAALDADSEGEEGKFYVWTVDEIQAALGDTEATAEFCATFGVVPSGNFEHGRSILHLPRRLDEVSRERGCSEADLRERLARSAARLLAVRTQRVPPSRDDKVLTGWNALLASGYARAAGAAEAWGDVELAQRWETLAKSCCARLWADHVDDDGRVYRARLGARAHTRAVLDDVVFLARACLDVHERTLEPELLGRAATLCRYVLDHHARSNGGFFLTPDDGEILIERTESLHDGPIPSGVGVALEVLLRIDAHGEADKRVRVAIDQLLARFAGAANHPFAHASVLLAAGYAGRDATHVSIVAPHPSDSRAQALAKVTRMTRIRLGTPVSLSFSVGERAEAMVCRDNRCSLPLHDARELEEALRCRPS